MRAEKTPMGRLYVRSLFLGLGSTTYIGSFGLFQTPRKLEASDGQIPLRNASLVGHLLATVCKVNCCPCGSVLVGTGDWRWGCFPRFFLDDFQKYVDDKIFYKYTKCYTLYYGYESCKGYIKGFGCVVYDTDSERANGFNT